MCGGVVLDQVPNLLKQAGNGISCTLRVLYHLYTPEIERDLAERGGQAPLVSDGEAESLAPPPPPPPQQDPDAGHSVADSQPATDQSERQTIAEPRLLALCQDVLVGDMPSWSDERQPFQVSFSGLFVGLIGTLLMLPTDILLNFSRARPGYPRRCRPPRWCGGWHGWVECRCVLASSRSARSAPSAAASFD